jgi:hypothetical protein
MPEASSIDPAIIGAEARVDRFFDRLAHVAAADLEGWSVPESVLDDRAESRRQAVDAAAAAGLGGLIVEARQRARDFVTQAYLADQYRPTWVGLNWGVSSGRVEDRLVVTRAVEDAAIAAVVDGVVPPEIVGDLREPFELVSSVDARGDMPARRRLGPVALALVLAILGVWILDLVFFGFQFGVVAVGLPVLMGLAIIVKASRVGPDA